MANIKLTNLASYRAYFADIALKHKLIDGYKWGDEEVISNDNRSDMPARFLWAIPYDLARFSDRLSDNVHKIKQGRISYFIVPASENFSDIESAYDFCEAVIEDIVAKILQDKRGYDVPTGDPPVNVWTMLITNVSSFTMSPTQHSPGSTKYIGCELKIDFMDPTNLSYNPDKWNS